MRGGRKPKVKALDATLSRLNDYLFKLIAMGTAIPEMELDEREADALGEAEADCIRTLPTKKVKAVEQKLDAISPWIGLAGTLAVVMYPRIQHFKHVQSERARRASGIRNAPFATPDVGATATGAETGDGATAGAQGKAPGDFLGSGSQI